MPFKKVDCKKEIKEFMEVENMHFKFLEKLLDFKGIPYTCYDEEDDMYPTIYFKNYYVYYNFLFDCYFLKDRNSRKELTRFNDYKDLLNYIQEELI